MSHIFSSKKTLLIFSLIILIGSYLRLSGIFTNSFGFTYDVGRDMLVIQKMLAEHKPILIGATTGLEGVFYGPSWYYILTIPFILFRGNPQGIAYFMAFVGIVCIFLAYILGKKIHGDFLALVFAALISISPAMVGLSVQIWNPNLTPAFVLISLFLVYDLLLGKERVSKIKIFFLGVVLGLIIDMELVFGILYLIGVSLAVCIIARKKTLHNYFLFTFFGILLINIPRIAFEFRHQFLMTKNLLSFVTGKTAPEKTLPLLDAVINRVSIFFNTFTDTLTNGNKPLAFLSMCFVVFSLVHHYKNKNKQINVLVIFVSTILIVFIIGLTFFPHDIFSHYLVGLPVLYLLLVAISIMSKDFIHRSIAMILLVMVVVVSLDPIKRLSSFTEPLWEGNAAVYRNQLAVVDYVYAKAKNEEFNYIAYTPAVYDYTYQYLLSWYGKTQYGYSPTVEKRNLFFVILEPDFEKPERLTRWLEVRKDDGKIISDREIKGGIRVQIRTH